MRQAAGLGLYTCKLLVEKQGGTITIRNHPAGGCEITIEMPLCQPTVGGSMGVSVATSNKAHLS
ncbi:hypothetical protein KDA_67560 [Dictyobacter alpinus]|uniref:Histidine kinase/HSP90-like ATPase domain-containing protein n=1 Tax=Dictyobacter alpinus TaxID=2014873 RepID=A0A402BJ53_9CHLR|nr:hypothetical protein KDA_67560 [Dictyobacter alpinus]